MRRGSVGNEPIDGTLSAFKETFLIVPVKAARCGRRARFSPVLLLHCSPPLAQRAAYRDSTMIIIAAGEEVGSSGGLFSSAAGCSASGFSPMVSGSSSSLGGSGVEGGSGVRGGAEVEAEMVGFI